MCSAFWQCHHAHVLSGLSDPHRLGITRRSYLCNWELTSFTANGTNEVLAHYLQSEFYVFRYQRVGRGMRKCERWDHLVRKKASH